MKQTLQTLLILLCGVLLGTSINVTHGQRRKVSPSNDWEAVLLGRCEQIRSKRDRLNCYDDRARQKALEDLDYRAPAPAPSINQTMQNSPGGIQDGGSIEWAKISPLSSRWLTLCCGFDYAKMEKMVIYLDVIKGLKTIELIDGQTVKTINVDEIKNQAMAK